MSAASLPPTSWDAGTFFWDTKTYVMAILNATPDSFSGDGIAGSPEVAGDLAAAAVASGADVIDIGAESTRPGHQPVTANEELTRLLPVLEAVSTRVNVPISVDTSKAVVADTALRAGASMVNDVRGFIQDPELTAVVAAHGVPAVVMHDVPPDGRGDLLSAIARELSRRLDRAVVAGIAWERLIIDPGFGFGKDWRQNLELLRRLGELRVLGRPILVGISRKGTIGRVLGLPEHDRIEGTAATVALAIAAGADIVRVHDVRAMTRVAQMTDAVIRRVPDEPMGWESARNEHLK
jgi:dihydropteroate synthase